MAAIKRKRTKWNQLMRNFPETDLNDLIVEAKDLAKEIKINDRYMRMHHVSETKCKEIFKGINGLLVKLMRGLEEYYGEEDYEPAPDKKSPLEEIKNDLRNSLQLPNQSKGDLGSDQYVSTQQLATAMRTKDTATIFLVTGKIESILDIYFFEPAWETVLEKRNEMMDTYMEKILASRGITKEEAKRDDGLM